jgi:hypothetical protein
VPRRWVALDFDGVSKPDWIDPADLLGCACVAIRTLPIEFRQATFIVQATACHGLKPGIRIRLWGWMSRPVYGAELKYWLRSAPVDRAVFGAAQVIYTAAPLFLPGAFDPLPARIDVIPGKGQVIVPSSDRLKPRCGSRRWRCGQIKSNISALVRAVTSAPEGNRNCLLYWAARRVAENSAVDLDTAVAQLQAAALQTGLPASAAAATIRSALRGGGHV